MSLDPPPLSPLPPLPPDLRTFADSAALRDLARRQRQPQRPLSTGLAYVPLLPPPPAPTPGADYATWTGADGFQDSPEVFLSDYRMYKFRPYEMHVVLMRRWRMSRKLSMQDVFDAGLASKCCKSSSVGTPAVCDRCGPIVFVARDVKVPGGNVPEEIAAGVERYTFAVKSRCTSSKDHLDSALVLWLDQLQATRPVVSKPFVVLARVKRSRRQKLDLRQGYRTDDPAAAMAAGYSSYSSRGITLGEEGESSPTSPRVFQDGLNRGDIVAPPTPFCLPASAPVPPSPRLQSLQAQYQAQLQQKLLALRRRAAAAAMPPPPPPHLTPSQRTFHLLVPSVDESMRAILASRETQVVCAGAVLMMRVFRTACDQKTVALVVTGAVAAIAARQEHGYQFHKISGLPENVYIALASYTNSAAASAGSDVLMKYLSNELAGTPNPLQKNLFQDGFCEVLAEIVC